MRRHQNLKGCQSYSVRLSESLARLHCDDEVRPVYIREAFRLFGQSIIHVETEELASRMRMRMRGRRWERLVR
jgi:DNA replicative helicase MCM subunit Mcm2 (Cdc46/Mcm family)